MTSQTWGEGVQKGLGTPLFTQFVGYTPGGIGW